MSFSSTDLKKNNISKKLGALLPQIDPHVKWVDYIPGTAIRTGQSLIAIGMISGDVKYVNVSNKSPFKLVNEVLNAMDDYCLDVQFLTKKQISVILPDITALAKDRAKVANETLTMLRHSDLSNEDCLNIVRSAQENGVFPAFFPEKNNPARVSAQILENFLKTNAATFIDTQIISDLIAQQIEIMKDRECEIFKERE